MMFGIDYSATEWRTRGRKLAVALVVAAAWLAAPTNALALFVTDYALSNATAVLNGQQYSITGLFSTLGTEEFFAQFQLTGSGPLAGTFLCGSSPLPGTCALPLNTSSGVASAGIFQIGYSGSAITSVGFVGLPASFTDNAPTGTIVPVGGDIEYSFSADAATVINGTPYSITGNFGYDPLTGYEFGGPLFINLNGPPPYGAQQCFFDAEPVALLNVITYTCPAYLSLEFANDLSNAPDPLQELFGSAVPFPVPATGFACPGPCPIETPEPGSLALLGTALGLFRLGFRVVRHSPPLGA